MTTPTTPPGWYPDPAGSGTQRFWTGTQWAEPPTTESPAASAGSTAAAPSGATEPPAAPEPPPLDYPGPPQADGRKSLIRNYIIGVAAGLALLLAVSVWGAFNQPEPIRMGSPSTSLTEEVEPDIGSTDTSDSVATDEPAADDLEPSGTVDANLDFAVASIEATNNVSSPTNEYLSKDAQGEFIVVGLSITNVGGETAFYMANLQKLVSGTDSYEADPEASYYLGNIYEEIEPGATVESSLVFDVPPGTVPDALEVHGDAIGSGTMVPLQ